jgi:F1F0 ATPase subunit 2
MIAELALSLVGGMILGSIYLGGLFLTVRRLNDVSQPAMLMLGSYALRLAILLGGFYFIMDGRWERLVAALAGFIIVRTVIIRTVRPEAFRVNIERIGGLS